MKIPPNFGRYEVLDLISQGGMGTLFRARDPRIGRYVAVKVLKRSFDTEELRDRFSREATAAGCLSHPNIVTIYDVGEHEGLPFIAMEYVRGETFVELIGLKPPLPVDRKLQLMEEVCAGLAHAHEAGIVHRDIKPANLILSSEGTVKILDFGIAKLSSANLTIPGAIMGTLNYMSPEQAKGNPVDARTDVFAVGVVMYELLSHQPAFTGTYATEALHKILSGSPTPITEYCPGLDPRLVQLIDRLLEKDPDKRYQTIAAVGKAIAGIRHDSQRVTRSAPRTTPRPVPRTSNPATVRAEQIEDLLAAAERSFDSGDYDGAIDACKQVLLLDATNQRALAELNRVQAAVDDRQAEVHAAVERGRAAFAAGNVMSALREVKQALALDPTDGDALALSAQTEQAIKERQEDARIRAAVGAARRQFAAGDHRAAIASLEALQALQAPANPMVRSAIDELRSALDQIDEQQRIEAELLEHRREELDRTFGAFDARLRAGDLARADESLTAATTLGGSDTRLPAARQRLSVAHAAAAARAAAEARAREGEQALDSAHAALEAGDLAAAGALIERARGLAPDHPRLGDVSTQLKLALERQAAAEAAERLRREVETLVRSASAHLDAAPGHPSELAQALADVNRALELDPSSADAAAMKDAVDAAIAARREAQRVRAAIDNAGRRFANGKHLAAIKLLEDFDPPTHPDVVKALGELRSALQIIEEKRRAEQERLERQRRVAALVNDARTALQEARFDDALQMLATAEGVDAAAPDVAPLRDEVAQAQAAARLRADIDSVVSEIDSRLSSGDIDAARDLLGRASALSATDAAVAGARQRIDQTVAEREAAAREAAAAREREAAAAREREAAAAREREAAAQREREAAAQREREAAAAREAAAREAAAQREREAAAQREREAAAQREREAAAAREAAAREAAVQREREAAAAREAAAREAVAQREREAAAAREAAAREAAAQREREAAAAREAAAREAAAVREREAAAAREAAAREAAARREREAAAAKEAAARQAAAAREREAVLRREAEARAKFAAREREVANDPGAETLFAGDLQDAVRAALEAAARDRQGPSIAPPGATQIVEPRRDAAAEDAARARRKADDLLAAARIQLRGPSPQMADVTSALEKIEQALAAVPNDPDALALETTANETLARLRDTARIDAAIRNARSRFAIGKHQAAIQLLEGLDPASHQSVADALKELRAALQAIEDRRRQAAKPARPAQPVDDDATRVILIPEILAKMQAEGNASMVGPDVPATPAPAAQPDVSSAPPPDADSQRRLMIFGGVLLLLLVIALVLLRVAP